MGKLANLSPVAKNANWYHSFGAVVDEGVFEELLQQAFYGL